MEWEESDDEEEPSSSASQSSIWSSLTSLVGNKQLKSEDIEPVIAKMRDHLIGKNVASDVANKLCQSVSSKLEGKVIGNSIRDKLHVISDRFFT